MCVRECVYVSETVCMCERRGEFACVRGCVCVSVCMCERVYVCETVYMCV